MSRTVLAVDHMTAQRVLDAAVGRFAANGYHSTSMRGIAADAQLSVGSVYDHFASKEAILFEAIDAAYAALLRQTQAMVAAAGDDPAAQLDAAVYAHCDFYTRYPRTGSVAQREARNLDDGHRALITTRRRDLARIFTDILTDGVVEGVFDIQDTATVGRALSTMCEAISSWYERGDSEAPRQIARTYCDLCARMTGLRMHHRGGAHGRLTAVPARMSA